MLRRGARKGSRADSISLLQAEEKKSGVQTKPPGIHLCQLPYVDDKRDHGLTSTASIVAMPSESLGERSTGRELTALTRSCRRA